MSFKFVARCLDDAVEIRLVERKLFGRSKTWPPNEWKNAPSEFAPAVRRLLGCLLDGRATTEGGSLLLSNSAAAELPETIAGFAGLAPPAGVMLDVSVRNTIGDPNCFVETRWSDTRFRPIEPHRSGVELTWGNNVGRLTGPLFELVRAIEAFNASRGTNVDARIALWTPLKAALDRVAPDLVTVDDYARKLTIFQAGSFALDVQIQPQGLDFTPVLMSRSKGRSLEDDVPGAAEIAGEPGPENETDLFEALRSQEADALLVPEDQREFVRQYSARPGVNPAYLLGRRSTYVLIDPDLRQALDVVRRVRTGSEDEKRAFIRNPRPAIARALGLEGGDALVTALFVETKQYSDRVLGLGVWERPELPWLSKAQTRWVPESFPVRVAGEAVEVTREEIEKLSADLDAAREKGEPETPFREKSVPLAAAEEMVAEWRRQDDEAKEAKGFNEADEPPALEPLAEPPAVSETVDEETAPEAAEDGPLVIQIKTNFEDVGYHLALTSRKALLPAEPPPEKMARTRFKPHQEKGFAWLLDAWKVGWPGVLLADDMGLGKSFQGLAFLAWIKANQDAARERKVGEVERGPVLVVAPTALLQNWIKEAQTHLAPGALGEPICAFGPGLKALKKTDRDAAPDDSLDRDKLKDSGWILTTYETLADNQRSFAQIRFSVALFDEMQKIKDPGTLNTFAAKAMNADFVLGLTGTPVENRIEDLWSIMDRIVPGWLGDLKSFSTAHNEADEAVYIALKNKLTKEQDQAPPVMLRRMKEDNLEGLPAKEVQSYKVGMPKPQADAYDKIIEAARAAKGASRNAMLETIQRLRSVSLYPDDPGTFDLSDPAEARRWAERSARLKKTFDILGEIDRKNEKALVFVEHREMQTRFAEAVATLLELDALPPIINGAVPGAKRQKIVDEFQAARTRFGLMILSPKAAGVGLTITAANHVIHLSRWWNPAVEDQCNDRVYRIGQNRKVTIHLPIAVHPAWGDHTFDVTLDQLLERKRKLSRTLLAPPVGDQDVDEIFSRTVTQ